MVAVFQALNASGRTSLSGLMIPSAGLGTYINRADLILLKSIVVLLIN